MSPEANEYAKSSTDDVTAANEEAAFDPNITDPQEAKEKVGEGNRVNPLDASPANPELRREPRKRREGQSKSCLREMVGRRPGGGGSWKGRGKCLNDIEQLRKSRTGYLTQRGQDCTYWKQHT
jgi:hypothetical protein